MNRRDFAGAVGAVSLAASIPIGATFAGARSLTLQEAAALRIGEFGPAAKAGLFAGWSHVDLIELYRSAARREYDELRERFGAGVRIRNTLTGEWQPMPLPDWPA